MRRQRSFRLPTAVVCAASLFIEAFDSVALGVAVPAIAAEFHTSLAAANLANVAYLLTLGVMIPAAGHLIDRWGLRATMLVGIGLFTVASVACTGAGSLEVLVTARAMQGLGGALIVTAGRRRSSTGLTPTTSSKPWPI